MNILYIDFETTGIDPDKCAPLDFAARLCVAERGLYEIAAFDTGLMRPYPDALITDEALSINGFTREELPSGRGPGDAAVEFCDWLDAHQGNEGGTVNPVILAGHNVQFDAAFLKRWFEYAGIQSRLNRFHYRRLDVQSVAFAMLGIRDGLGSVSLGACTKHLGIEHQPHSAYSDVKAGLDVLRRLVSASSEKE